VTPEQAILERILSLSAVTALVGQRVFMLKLRQGETLPAVRVQLVDEGMAQHLRGGSGIFQSRIQVDVYATEFTAGDPYAAATEIALAIHGDDAGSGLSGWMGLSGGSPPEIRVCAVSRKLRLVGYEAEERREVRVQQDYIVDWKRVA
jgi:hypothetical protein